MRTKCFLEVMRFEHEDENAIITKGKLDSEVTASRTAPDLSMRYKLVPCTGHPKV